MIPEVGTWLDLEQGFWRSNECSCMPDSQSGLFLNIPLLT